MSRQGDDDVPFDPFNEEDDPFRPQRPLSDPLRRGPDPFRVSNDPFQLDDPFQQPADPYGRPGDPYGPPSDRTGGFDALPPEPPPAAPTPEQAPPGGSTPSEQRRQAPIPSRAARHQQKRRISWPFSRRSGTPGPATPKTGAPGAGGPAWGGPGAGGPGSADPRAGEGAAGPGPAARGWGSPGGPASGPGAPGSPGGSASGPGAPGGRPSPPRPDRQPGDRGGPGQPGGRGGDPGRPGDPGDPRRPIPRGSPGDQGRAGGTTGPFDAVPGARPGSTSGQFGRVPGGGAPRPGGGPRPGAGGTTGPFDAVRGGRQPGGTTGPFDAVKGGRPPGGTGPFDAARPDQRGSTGEFPRPSSPNGRNGGTAPPAVGQGPPVGRVARRSHVPHPARQLPTLPKFEVPTGLARTTLGLVAILVLATAGLGVVTRALPTAKPPATPATAAPYSARWICPMLPNQSTSVGVANVGGDPATLRTTVVGGDGGSQPAQKPLEAGGLRTMNVPAAKKPGYVQVEAFSSPIAVGSGGQSSCASGPTDRWWIPAADTSLGASTTVVVANPDNDPAVVDLVPHVNQGALAAAAELFVPPRSAVVQTLSNGELIALKPAIEVIAKSGRVVAGAVIQQKDQQKIFVPGQPTARSAWSFAGGLAGTDRSTSVLITNPSSSPLSVSVQVSTDRGTFRPGNDFDNPIPAGSSAAIQVPPLSTRGSGAFALRINSRDGANFVAALRVSTPTSAGDVTYLDLGNGGADRSWFVPEIPASKQVVLANVGNGTVAARLGAAGTGKGGGTVKVAAGTVLVRPVPAGAKALEIVTERPGLLVAPLGGGLALAGAEIGGVPAGGPVVAGQAAA
jgi:Family of unknown function (DUF5719)